VLLLLLLPLRCFRPVVLLLLLLALQGASRRRLRTCEFVFTLVVSTESGPVRNSSASFASRSSTLIGCAAAIAAIYYR
jgi:hypothetical protein